MIYLITKPQYRALSKTGSEITIDPPDPIPAIGSTYLVATPRILTPLRCTVVSHQPFTIRRN